MLVANRSARHFSLFRRAIWHSCVELFRTEVQVEVARVPEDQGIFLAKASDLLPRRSFVRIDPTEEGLEGSQFFREGELAESGSFLRRLGATDAADPGGLRPLAPLSETGRRGAAEGEVAR